MFSSKYYPILILIALISNGFCDDLVKLSIAHINDFHARFEPISETLGPCKNESACVGGIARISTVIKQLKNDDDSYIFLNAGDNYQGSLWYNVFKWNATQYFLNFLPMDAMVFGNHEFDENMAGIIPFLEHAKVPVVACNIDASLEPSIDGLFNKSIVIERHGRKIGLIGVVLTSFDTLAHTGKLVFLDEADSINKEAKRLVEEEGVFTNIVLSHSGYDVDRLTAEKLGHKVGLIVGGHSHSILYSGDPPSNDNPSGPYPTIVKTKSGDTVLVVQAGAFTKYFGNISVFYNERGYPESWEGKPIYLDNKIEKDPQIVELLKPWQEVLKEYMKVYGETLVDLDISNCFNVECNIGNFIADAMVDAWKYKANNSWAYAAIGLINAGAIKSTIVKGNITYQDLLTTQPWNNSYDVVELQGKDIKKILDYSTRAHYYNTKVGDRYLIHVSGIKVVFNMSQPMGSRIHSIQVLCQDCEDPKYENIDDEKYYRVVTSSYLLLGRDSFTVVKDNMRNIEKGLLDIEVLSKYVAKMTPINTNVEGRIQIITI